MDWILIVTHKELGQCGASEDTVRRLMSRFRRDELIGFVLRLLGALNVDKEARFQTINRRFVEWAGERAADAMRQAQATDATATWLLIEPWQELLMLRSVIQHCPLDGVLHLESPEGKAAFLDACLSINDLTVPRGEPTTGDPVTDGLKAAATITPRLWLDNPPNLNNGVARMIVFLKDLPAQFDDIRPHADLLRRRFEESLGVPFGEALALTAFLGYWAIAQRPDQVLDDPTSALVNPQTWLEQTDIRADDWDRFRARVSAPLSQIGASVPGTGGHWFDPLRFRDRPLIELPNGFLFVSMPDLLAEKSSFDMFWWLTEGPAGAQQQNPWQTAFGKLCERYVLSTLHSIADATGGTIIPNFAWENGEIDALYWADGRLAMFEVSGSFVNNAQKMSGDWQSFRAGLATAFVERARNQRLKREAIAQLGRGIEWLTVVRRENRDVGIPLREIAVIHPVMVAPDRVVRTQGVWRFFDAELRQRLPDRMPWRVAPLAVLALEELEELEELVRRRDARLTGSLPALLHTLRLWEFDNHRYPSFWQFLADHFENNFGNERLRRTFLRWRDEIGGRFTRGH
jgi:hypothetical protein